jgi:hypothetical protein
LADPFIRFHWVVLQLAELERCSSHYEIDERLAELPKGLDKIYNRILENIDRNHRTYTKMFLQWLAFCKRPMTIEELAETVTMDFADKSPVFNWEKHFFDPRDVLMICSSFVSESKGKYRQLNPTFWALNCKYRNH